MVVRSQTMGDSVGCAVCFASEPRSLIALEMWIVCREEQAFQAICFVQDATWNPFPFKSQKLPNRPGLGLKPA
jgi:hypothetical protein